MSATAPALAVPSVRDVITYGLPQLLAHTFPKRRALLLRGSAPIFRAGHIGEVFAERGIGKTWFAQTLALIASHQAKALGLHTDAVSRVLYVDGEMSSEELQERFKKLVHFLKVTPNERLQVIGADWQPDFLPRLDLAAGQQAIAPFVETADLIFLDNRSSLFDPEGEKDPSAWQPAQEWLLSLRRRGKAVMLIHHANRQGGARGIGKPEDPMNLILRLSRPDGYSHDQGARFLVEFDKARGIYGAATAPFVATLGADGWTVEGKGKAEDEGTKQKLRDYLKTDTSLRDCPESMSTVAKEAGIRKGTGLKVLREMIEAHEVIKGEEGCFHVAA